MDIRTLINSKTWLSHIILESDRITLRDLVESDNYDPENVVLKITICDKEIRQETLEKIINGFVERIVESEKEKVPELVRSVEYLQTKEGLIEKAKELAKEMCQEMANKFEWE